MSTKAVSNINEIKKRFTLLCELRRRYKIEIVTDESDNSHPLINYDLPDAEAVTPYLKFLHDELAVYPVGLISKLQIDRIVVCSNFRRFNVSANGCASMSVFPDNLAIRMLFKKNTLYFDVKDGGTIDGLITIHHELFHAVEAHANSGSKNIDIGWSRLNPPGFQYKAEVLDARNYPLDSEGFLNESSMESLREDKAELFSHMIVNMAQVEEFAQKDKILRSKIVRLKTLLHTFSSEFNERFWASRHERSVHGALKDEYQDLLLTRLR